MKIPKDFDDLTNCGSCAHPDDNNVTCVPDDLLRERFAFAGEIKLTREEALDISQCLSVGAHSFSNNVQSQGFQNRRFDDAIKLLQSKLAEKG